jgi:dTDP-4-amino-4,6-dideoxygalactose transaminase
MSKLAICGGTPVRTEPYVPWPLYDEREKEALVRTLESRKWTSAPYIGETAATKLEERFAAYNGARYSVATGSGTDALQVAFAAAGVRAGDEVILAPNTFIAGVTPVLQLGAVPVFADVEPECFTLDPDAVEAAVNERTKAISPVYLAGYPCDIDRINEIAKRHGLRVVADACHAHGSEWRGAKVGSLVDLSAFSFQQDKNMTAGEGGAVVMNDPELYELCYMYHNDGRGIGDRMGVFEVMGWNYRLSGFQAAVLMVQLERLEETLDRRARSVAYLKRGLAGVEGLRFPREDPRVTRLTYLYPYLRYAESAFEGIPAALFAQALRAEGIPCSGGQGRTLYSHPLFTEQRFFFSSSRQVDYTQVRCPVAEAAGERSIRFRQTVLLSDESALDAFVEAVHKVRDNLAELKSLA